MQRRGFVGTTVEDVADHLDLTKAAFYYYLRNKEELLFEIAQQTLAIATERVSRIEGSVAGPREKLERIVDALVRLVAERPAFFSVYFEEKEHLAPAHLRAVTARERGIVAIVERILRDGMSKRVFRRADETVSAFIVFGMCFWTYKWYEADGRLSLDDISRSMQAAATQAFAKDPE